MSESRKPTINTYGLTPELARAMLPVKQSIEMITGARSGVRELSGLSSDASLEDLINKVNQIVARLNASGSYKLRGE